MIFKSIRWRLQLWYGVILVTVLAGFGLTAYQFERGRQLQNIDEELQRRISALMNGLGRPGPEDRGPDERFPNRPPPPEYGMGEGPQGDAPPRGKFKLTPAQTGLFAGDGKNAFYYIVWLRDDREMGRSTNAPAGVLIPRRNGSAGLNGPRMRGSWREMFYFTPLGECLLAGRSIAPDLAELRRFAWWLSAVGGVVLLCGLAGGWWLASHAIRPIEDISATAVKIAAGDLSQRINLADTESELGRLGGVLNSTFARLESAFAQQGQFTADATHELRTPVSVILTQVQTTLKHERDAADYRLTLEACQRAAQKMRHLLESLMELARLDAGQEPMRPRRFDLSHAVRDCIELVQPLANERGIIIQSELPTLEAMGDPERLAQVITNLLTNAIYYNRERGEVRIAAQRQNDLTLITVTDTGLGISAADLPHVFERFYRADKSRSDAAGRNGLGLSISKAIVEAHGGSIEVSSQPGNGATFTVRLPAK